MNRILRSKILTTHAYLKPTILESKLTQIKITNTHKTQTYYHDTQKKMAEPINHYKREIGSNTLHTNMNGQTGK